MSAWDKAYSAHLRSPGLCVAFTLGNLQQPIPMHFSLTCRMQLILEDIRGQPSQKTPNRPSEVLAFIF